MIEISKSIYYVGTNDRKKHLFENNWPLPNGVSYNSYLIADEKSALVDTLEYGSRNDYLSAIAELLQGRELDYLIVNHMEPDHSSMIGEIVKAYPKVRVVGNSKTFKLLESYYLLTEENKLVVSEGDTLELGYHKLMFVMIPWVHWPETMVTYDTVDKILFSCDAFGSFGTLDGGIFDDEVNFDYYLDEMRRYYSNIVGKWSNMVQKAIAKLNGVEIRILCPSHGIIWRENPAKPIKLYDGWSKHEAKEGVVIAYASMYGNVEKMADIIARKIAEEGIRNIRIFDVSKTHASYILSEIWKYKGLILATCAYNTVMHPMMTYLTDEILISAPQNKVLGIFGGSSWNGAGVKALKEFAVKANMPITEPIVEVFGIPDEAKMCNAGEFARVFVAQMRE